MSSEIAEYRQRVFADNVAKIQAHNARHQDWRLAVNEYADQTWEEFSEARLLKAGVQFPMINQSHRQILSRSKSIMDLPDSVNWVEQGAVTAVKNQGQCGSSWAFATTGVMEGAKKIQLGNPLVNLSEQQFLDCDASNAGCYGGQINNALLFAESGITTAASYPYRARPGSCRSSTPVLQVASYLQIASNDEVALATAVAMQPIAIGVEADSSVFQFYKSGVVTSTSCGTTLNHALLIVGYGTENGIPYWLCKNSWGRVWGDVGYIKIGRSLTSNGKPGVCGVASYPWAVTVAYPG